MKIEFSNRFIASSACCLVAITFSLPVLAKPSKTEVDNYATNYYRAIRAVSWRWHERAQEHAKLSNQRFLAQQPESSSWSRTRASGMGDVAVAPDGRVWLAGKNGTIWFGNSRGTNFTQVQGSGVRRISVAPNGVVWAVAENGTLWRLAEGNWNRTQASGMGDVAVAPNGTVWLAGKNGTIWFGNSRGPYFTQVQGSGFESVAVGQEGLWAVGQNGTLWLKR